MTHTTQHVEHRSFCRFCPALCGIVVTTEGDRVVKVRGDAEHPLSRGYTCPKGRALGEAHHSPDRLDHPMMRRNGRLERVSWDECLDDIASKLQALRETAGPHAIGAYMATASSFDATGRRMGERFLRALGSRSKYTATTVDTPCKPLVAHLMGGHPGLVPALDHEAATMVLLIGINPVVSHGHLNAFPDPVVRLRELAARGEVWVLDPRRTETAKLATRHLQPRAGTDHIVLAHAVRELLRDGADVEYLRDHARNVDRLREAVEPWDSERAAAESGLDPSELADLVAAIRRHRRVAGQTGTGTTMSPAANVTEWLTWALHVVTGSFERPGGMWFHPGFLKQLDRRSLAPTDAAAEPGPASRPDLPGRYGELPCAAMADEIAEGNLRGLFVLGANPVTSLPDTGRLAKLLESMDLLVALDVVHNETTAIATHVLPCYGQLERPDLPHYIDQFQPAVASHYTERVVEPVAERRAMWWPLAKIARRLGLDLLDGQDPDEVTDEDLLRPLAERSRASFAALREAPTAIVAEPSAMGWVEASLLPDGRWDAAPEVLVAQLRELPSPAPLVMTPRRQLRHLNSQLTELAGPDRPEALIHPADAREAGVSDGDLVRVRSVSGELVLAARVTEDIRRGAVSIPHGFGDHNVSLLTSGTTGVDPLTGMVTQSGLPISIEPIREPAPAGA